MGIIPFSFWHEYSFSDFQIKAFYFFKNKNEDFKDRWEQVRKISHINALVAGNKVEPHDVMAFPWDKEDNSSDAKQPKVISKEETEKIFKSYGLSKI